MGADDFLYFGVNPTIEPPPPLEGMTDGPGFPENESIHYRHLAKDVISAIGVVSKIVAVNGAYGDVVYDTRITGDQFPRLLINTGGEFYFGNGASAASVYLSRPATAQLRVTPTTNAAASTSAGGAFNVTHTASNGAGLVVYTEQGAPTGHNIVSRVNNPTYNQNGIFAQYNGTGHNVNISHSGTGQNSSGLNVGSTNPDHSAVGISGVETAKGTVKITHTGTGTDASASAISIDLAGSGTAAQGIFMTSAANSTGNFLEIRHGGPQAVFRVGNTGTIWMGDGNAAPNVAISHGAPNRLDITTADVRLASVGRGFRIAEGTNARMGVATLVAGTVTVANTTVTANTRIFLTAQNTGGTPGTLRISARTAGTNFTITSSSNTDTSQVAYFMMEPS